FLFCDLKIVVAIRSYHKNACFIFLFAIRNKLQRPGGKRAETNIGEMMHFAYYNKYRKVVAFVAEIAFAVTDTCRDKARLEPDLAQQFIKKPVQLVAKAAPVLADYFCVKLVGIKCYRPTPEDVHHLQRA